ncbi:hypothetical protein H9638_13295 [Arthrobacter sp. Sa2BUA2]|uniref:DUF2975 domain-containing protein n=1 Tax=Arthrobacter pullicola TaxID=2762224 RepID=A0ABR8YL59_9MICC|nr:DUF6766 family protein [Arthrobacter pullicola]MBD8044783.1 hypothetical protein [Arthrobacter pullicola]
MKALKHNGLFIVFFSLFLLSLAGQALAGLALFNEQQVAAGLEQVSIWQYLTTSSFAVDVAENWQSEFLQFLLLILAAVWFVQQGSPESKKLGSEGTESDKDQLLGRYARPDSPAWARAGGWRTRVYSNSLAAVMGTIFLLSWFAQSIAGFSAFAEQQLANLQDPGTWGEYVLSPEFWSRTLQNWQSEFLAVASMVILAVYLRQRGSPESKPVGAAHTATDVEG